MTTDYGTSPTDCLGPARHRAGRRRPGDGTNGGPGSPTCVHRDGRWLAYYDGRASKEENAEERTGMAAGDDPGPSGGGRQSRRARPRRVRVAALHLVRSSSPDGGLRLYYETRRLDGAHDLRTEYVPPSR